MMAGESNLPEAVGVCQKGWYSPCFRCSNLLAAPNKSAKFYSQILSTLTFLNDTETNNQSTPKPFNGVQPLSCPSFARFRYLSSVAPPNNSPISTAHKFSLLGVAPNSSSQRYLIFRYTNNGITLIPIATYNSTKGVPYMVPFYMVSRKTIPLGFKDGTWFTWRSRYRFPLVGCCHWHVGLTSPSDSSPFLSALHSPPLRQPVLPTLPSSSRGAHSRPLSELQV